MKNFIRIFLAVVVVFLSSCTTIRTSIDFDETADFESFKTYNFSKEFQNIKMNDLDRRRLKNAINVEMNKLGYTIDAKPDLLVNAMLKTSEKIVTTNNHYGGYWGYGWGFRGGMSSIDVNSYTEGTLIIHLIDIQKKELIWEGRGEGLSEDKKNRSELISKAVNKIYQGYPVKE